ncbi:patatin-like protein 2 [Senna tora]|uniref:Patatin-like protein 2 n=1 Tax=Senna tora TaxID=362788 RepID=A0A834WZ24_9FABA|nr:patatin-like protein 2 [Senna tora]
MDGALDPDSSGYEQSAPKNEKKFDATMAAKWGILGWLSNQGSTPLVDVFTHSSADMVDFHVATVTQALQ